MKLFNIGGGLYFQRAGDEGKRSSYEEERILHAKQILKPFVLRRLKSEVSGANAFLCEFEHVSMKEDKSKENICVTAVYRKNFVG